MGTETSIPCDKHDMIRLKLVNYLGREERQSDFTFIVNIQIAKHFLLFIPVQV